MPRKRTRARDTKSGCATGNRAERAHPSHGPGARPQSARHTSPWDLVSVAVCLMDIRRRAFPINNIKVNTVLMKKSYGTKLKKNVSSVLVRHCGSATSRSPISLPSASCSPPVLLLCVGIGTQALLVSGHWSPGGQTDAHVGGRCVRPSSVLSSWPMAPSVPARLQLAPSPAVRAALVCTCRTQPPCNVPTRPAG